MSSVADAIPAKTSIDSTLQAGVEHISSQQTVTFTQYARVVLPLDGFVFWVRVGLLASNALTFAIGADGRPISAADLPGSQTITVPGSMHYVTTQGQDEDASFAVNRMIFTSLREIHDFNLVDGGLMYIGDFDGVRFAFSRRKSFYQQSGLYHYEGDAVYSIMDTQIIDDIADLNAGALVVSNSLPIWLALQSGSNWPQPHNPRIPIYPSFVVPDNLPPPYASAHIVPETTSAIQSAPYIDDGTHWQLVRETVRFTIYGERNTSALAFQDYLFQNSIDRPGTFGVLNMPVIRDEKRTQNELGILAMKKTFELDVSYYQSAVIDLALQFIHSCIPTFIIEA